MEKFKNYIPCADLLDFEEAPKRTLVIIFVVRFAFCMTFSEKSYHPD